MKDRKVILGTIMLFLAFFLVYLNLSFTENENEEPKGYNSYINAVTHPIKVDSGFLNLEIQEKDSLITVLAILNTKVCPSCVTNTLEFFNEAKQRDEFTAMKHIIFIDEEEEKVERFIEITRLNHPVKKISSKEIDPFFHDKTKVLIFLNSSSEVFYYLPIPVAHASITAINNEIDNIIELNKINLKSKTNQTSK